MTTKKILAIFMSMLVIALIPAAAGAVVEQKQAPEIAVEEATEIIETPEPAIGIGVTWMFGIITKIHQIDNRHSVFRCIAVRYFTRGLGPLNQQMGVLRGLQKLTVESEWFAFGGPGLIGGGVNSPVQFIYGRWPHILDVPSTY